MSNEAVSRGRHTERERALLRSPFVEDRAAMRLRVVKCRADNPELTLKQIGSRFSLGAEAVRSILKRMVGEKKL